MRRSAHHRCAQSQSLCFRPFLVPALVRARGSQRGVEGTTSDLVGTGALGVRCRFSANPGRDGPRLVDRQFHRPASQQSEGRVLRKVGDRPVNTAGRKAQRSSLRLAQWEDDYLGNARQQVAWRFLDIIKRQLVDFAGLREQRIAARNDLICQRLIHEYGRSLSLC